MAGLGQLPGVEEVRQLVSNSLAGKPAFTSGKCQLIAGVMVQAGIYDSDVVHVRCAQQHV